VDAPPPAPGVTGVMVTCQTPISSAATSQCTASVSPSTVAQTVTWSDSAGTISGTGLLTAPTVTTTTNVTVTATSTVDPTKNGSFTVVVNAPAPMPQLVGKGGAVRLNILGTDPIVGFGASDGTHVVDVSRGTTTIYQGGLQDLENGVALTATNYPQNEIPASLFLNGVQVASVCCGNSFVIAGSNVAWLAGGVVVNTNPQTTLPSPPGDFSGLSAAGSYIAWSVASLPNTPKNCSVYVNSIVVSDNSCFVQTKLIVLADGTVYVGWAYGTSVYAAVSKDAGATWTITTIATGANPPNGIPQMDYAVRADGSIIFVWTQSVAGDAGATSVWESDAGGLPVRLSGVARPGFSGAGEAFVASDGSAVWVDDGVGNASGDYHVFLNGIDLSHGDGPELRLLPDGTRVVAWDDASSVWLEKIPK